MTGAEQYSAPIPVRMEFRGGTALQMSICKQCWDNGETQKKCDHCTRCLVNNKSTKRNQCKTCCDLRTSDITVGSKGTLKLRFEVLDTITDVNQGRVSKLKRSITELDEVVLISVQGCEFQEANLHGSDGIQTYGSSTHVPAVKKNAI